MAYVGSLYDSVSNFTRQEANTIIARHWAVFGPAPHSYLKYRSILARGRRGVHLHFTA